MPNPTLEKHEDKRLEKRRTDFRQALKARIDEVINSAIHENEPVLGFLEMENNIDEALWRVICHTKEKLGKDHG